MSEYTHDEIKYMMTEYSSGPKKVVRQLLDEVYSLKKRVDVLEGKLSPPEPKLYTFGEVLELLANHDFRELEFSRHNNSGYQIKLTYAGLVHDDDSDFIIDATDIKSKWTLVKGEIRQ
jgi:hypothetical protein